MQRLLCVFSFITELAKLRRFSAFTGSNQAHHEAKASCTLDLAAEMNVQLFFLQFFVISDEFSKK